MLSTRSLWRMGLLAVACPSAALLATPPVAAETTPYLVRDVNDTADHALGTFPRELTPLGDDLFFIGYDQGSGEELHRLDAQGRLHLVADLLPGLNVATNQAPEQLTVSGGQLYFVMETSLWRTGGTVESTTEVFRSTPFKPFDLTAAGNLLYFRTNDFSVENLLWRSDGSAAGTFPIGPVPWYGMTAVGARLVYLRPDPATGLEPWVSDGTAAGTHILKDVCPGPCSGIEGDGGFTVVGQTLYFRGTEPSTGAELWRSDGTPAGTSIVTDLVPGPESALGQFVPLRGGLLFSTYDPRAIWWTDGTAAGTTSIASLWAAWLVTSGNVTFFSGFEPGTGWELWKTDGTVGGTALVADLCPGACSFMPGDVRLSAASFGVLLARPTNQRDFELWGSDGTTAGTLLLRRFGDVSEVAPPFGTQYFVAQDEANGPEIWRTDGSVAGTTLATDQAERSAVTFLVEPRLVPVGDRVFFPAFRPDLGIELWSSRGTAASTTAVEMTPGPEGAAPTHYGVLDGALLFTPGNGPGGVWRSDGTQTGTTILSPTFAFSDFTTSGPLAYFAAGGAAFNNEPWRTDGTAAGTFELADVEPGPSGSQPTAFTPFAGATYFLDHGTTPGIWRTDGTTAGTTPVVSRACRSLVAAETQLFLQCLDAATGEELWRSDGTAAGTRLVKDIYAGTASQEIRQMTTIGDVVYFTVPTELWRSDGTEAGTRSLSQFISGAVPFEPQLLAVSGGVLFFSGNWPGAGRELWRTDGTAAGTFLLRDIAPGELSGMAADAAAMVTATDAGVVFAAYTRERGFELWTSDGTAAGTLPLPEIAPGPPSASPRRLARAGGVVYALATDGSRGYELWAVPVATPTVAVTDAGFVAEGDAGSSNATFEVRRLSPTGQALSVSYQTVPGTAAADTDYEPRSGVLTFAPEIDVLTVTVPVLGDLLDEADETFSLELTATDPVVVGDGQAEATITDDDGPRFAAAGTSVTEGETGSVPATVVVTLTTKDGTPLPSAAAVGYATEAGTATPVLDFGPVSGTLTFPAGAPSGTTRTVDVAVHGDLIDEPDEVFGLRLSVTGDATAAGPGMVSIADDDGIDAAAPLELAPGSVLRADLAPPAGRAQDRDYFVIAQQPQSSYEVVVDEVSGDAAPLTFVRRAGATVLQAAATVGTGSALSLRWQNESSTVVGDQHLAVSSDACISASCGADDRYRVRAYETTLFAPRFNNIGGHGTVVLLQNRSSDPISGRLLLWQPSGSLGHAEPFTIPARGALAINTLALFPYSGTLTVTHDGPYGGLVGKAVALEPATGFSFDTLLSARPR